MATKRTTRTRTFKTGVAALSAGAVLAVGGLAMNPASASVADPTPEPYEGNLDCADLGHDIEFKIDEQPANGKYDLNNDDDVDNVKTVGDVPDDAFITISNVELVNGRMEFDWSSNYVWAVVLVKQANGGLKYVYDPPVSHDENVQTVTGDNQGGISHVTFCDPSTPPTTTTPTTEEETTTTTEGTTTSETVLDTVVTPTTAADPTTSETVAGVQVTRQLPRTGTGTTVMLLSAAGLMATGLALVASARLREQRV